MIDPSSSFGTPYDCNLSQGAPTASNCESGDEVIGASSGSALRTVLSLSNFTSIPVDAQIDEAHLSLEVDSVTGTPGPVGAYELTDAFGQGASWNDAYSGVSWTTPGGDHAASPIGSGTVPTASGDYLTIPLSTSAVQAIVSGQSPNIGLELLDNNETGTSYASFQPSYDYGALFFDVTWQYNTLASNPYPTWSYKVDSQQGMDVSLANGQLGVTAQDMNLAGTGLNADITRYYNSSSGWGTDTAYAWGLGVGSDAGLWIYPDDVVVTLPGTTGERFYSNGSGGFTSPPGVDAVLSEPSTGHYQLVFDRSQKRIDYETLPNCSGGAVPVSEADRNGDTISYAYSSTTCGESGLGHITSMTDTRGRTVTFADNSTYIFGATDPTGRAVTYNLGGANGSLMTSSG